MKGPAGMIREARSAFPLPLVPMAIRPIPWTTPSGAAWKQFSNPNPAIKSICWHLSPLFQCNIATPEYKRMSPKMLFYIFPVLKKKHTSSNNEFRKTFMSPPGISMVRDGPRLEASEDYKPARPASHGRFVQIFSEFKWRHWFFFQIIKMHVISNGFISFHIVSYRFMWNLIVCHIFSYHITLFHID